MPKYVNSQNSYFFREIGRKAGAGEVIELPEESYAKYQKSHPGLLRPALLNTMAEVPVIRSEEPAADHVEKPVAAEPVAEKKPRGRKPRAKK
jgi:hypothetical protein